MPGKILRVALIGAAGKVAAPCHLNALKRVDRLELVALCDLDEESLARIADGHAVSKRYTDYHAVLADPDVDAVDIVVPPFLHAEIAIAAAKAGKHIYVEKPMARNLGEARAMLAAADSAQVLLMLGESYVFHGPHVLACGLIEAGSIGQVVQVRQTKGPWVFRQSENNRLGGRGHDALWRFDPDLSGGGDFPWMMDHGPHFFATARLFVAKRRIEKVTALCRGHGFGRESHLKGITAVSWVFEWDQADGIWTQVDTPVEANHLIGFRTEIFGTEGTIRVFGEGGGAAPGFPQVAPVTLYRDAKATDYDPREGQDRAWLSNNSYYDCAHAHALGHFADAVLDGVPLCYDGHQGFHDLAATLATIKSAKEGRAVALREISDEWTAYAKP